MLSAPSLSLPRLVSTAIPVTTSHTSELGHILRLSGESSHGEFPILFVMVPVGDGRLIVHQAYFVTSTDVAHKNQHPQLG